MNRFFLLNEAIESEQFTVFKKGMINLMQIEKDSDHDFFFKHDSIYNLNIFTDLCTLLAHGQDEQAIFEFIEKGFRGSQQYLNDDNTIDTFFNSNKNGFLGVDFTSVTGVSETRQVVDNKSFKDCKNNQLTNFEKLNKIFANVVIASSFRNSFNDASADIQLSIIDHFEKANARGTRFLFQPDGALIKDVSPSNRKVSIYELRIFNPIAIRVYFHVAGQDVYIASFDPKANPNQSRDIQYAHDVIYELKVNR
jgi:hypothetical protein